MRELSRLTEFCITKTPIKAIGLPKSGDTLFHKFPRKNGFFTAGHTDMCETAAA